MLNKELLEVLSYKCGCPLDIRESLGIVNGICPTHPKNKLLYDGMDLATYQAFMKRRNGNSKEEENKQQS